MDARCRMCGAPCTEAQVHCSKGCARVAREAERDGIEGRLRRAFQRRKRLPAAAPDALAEPMFFEVEGLWAPGCAPAIEEILKTVGGATDARLVGETGRGRAYFDPERTSESQLLEILDRYGFRAAVVRDAWARAEGFSRPWELALAVRLGVTGMLTLAVALMSFLLRTGTAGDSATLRALMFFFTVPVLLFGGYPVLSNAVRAVAGRRVTPDLMTAAAALGTFAVSVRGLLEGSGLWFDAACAVVAATLFARICEYRARRRLARAGERLSGLVGGNALRLRRGEEIPCAASELRPGDTVLVGTGGRVPVDGDAVEGSAVLKPPSGGRVEVSPGDRVSAGARVVSGKLVVRAERTGAATSVGELARMVELSVATRLPGAGQAARGLTFIGLAVTLGAAYALLSPASHDGGLPAASAVLLVVAPAAVALFPAISALSAMGRAAEGFACFRSGEALAKAAEVDAVVLSRSALVEPRASAAPAGLDAAPAEFWTVVASLSALSPGPVAAALRERARIEGAGAAAVVSAAEGGLSRSIVDRKDAALGGRAAIQALGWSLPGTLRPLLAEEERGRTLVWCGWDGAIRGAVAIEATEREGAEGVGRALGRMGVLTCLAGHDADAALDAQATRLGLGTWLSEASLGESLVKRRGSGRRTGLVVRAAADVPAGVAESDVVMAMDCGDEGTPEWAGVAALGPDVGAVTAAIGAAQRAQASRRRAGALAFLYHVAAVPLAAAGLLDPLSALGMGVVCGLVMIGIGLRAGGRAG